MGERAAGAELTPVTIIGGYLGAGKTTLINQLLAGDHGRRLAVLVNDFGSIAIDEDLISSHDGTTISLTNGCVCCSLADSLGDGLDEVLSLTPSPDQIIIEASGVADPGKIAAYGQGWPGCRLDAVFTVVDVETIRQRLNDQFVGRLVTTQLNRADLILLSKCDLVNDSTMETVTSLLGDLANAPLIELRPGGLQPEFILDLEPGTAQHDLIPESTIEASELFETAVLRCPDPMDRSELERALNRWPDSIVRVKGVVALRDESGLQIVQRVGRRWTIEPLPGDTALLANANALVIISLRGQPHRASLDVRPFSGTSVCPRREESEGEK